MSTRANIIITDKHNSLQLYRHSDGYPESVLTDLREVLPYAWELPRMEADDMAAAIVRAWKRGPGNIYIDGTANLPDSLHPDIEYHYIISPDEKKRCWKVDTYQRDTMVGTTYLK